MNQPKPYDCNNEHNVKANFTTCTSLMKGESGGIRTTANDDARREKKDRLGGFDIEFRGLSTVITSGNINNMCAGA